jgi:competence protein ComK
LIEVTNYLVTGNTIALTEIYHPEFNTKIYDVKGIYYSKQTAKRIVHKSCLMYGASYQGRIEAVRNAFPYDKRTPLMFCPILMIYAFPTKSPDDFACRWIFPAHIQTYILENNHLSVLFKNGMKLELNCSLKTYMKQKERTAHCLTHFSMKYHGLNYDNFTCLSPPDICRRLKD